MGRWLKKYSERAQSSTDNADNPDTLSQKSPLDTSVETDAPARNISDRLGVDPDNPDTVDKKDPKRPQINTDSADNADTLEQVDGKTLAGLATLAPVKDRDPNTGDVVPRALAKLEPPPSEAFTAKLVSFCPKRSPEAIPLVDIRCPANSGGMKGLVFKVSQVPGLIRALEEVQVEAVERGLIEKPVGQ
jgi:hypothetical protein